VNILLLKSASLMHWSVVLWRARKPNWHGFSMLLSPMCLRVILRMTFSNTLPVEGRRLIGLKFWRSFGFLPGFGKVIIFSYFQDKGKCEILKHCLNRRVRWTIGFHRCLRHSFGLPSIPLDFFNLKEFISFWTWQGLPFSEGLLFTASSKA